jgi:beta-mannosidase
VTCGLEPIPAKVPGNVELDLLRAGQIADPFFGDHIRDLRPYEFYEWWYRRTITLDPTDTKENWELIFEGIDTIASIWINGQMVGNAQNMLIEHRFDVTDFLNFSSENEIVVHIQSAVNYARNFSYDAVLKGPDAHEESIFVRKPPHSYGWDIMPRAVSAGIWRRVRLESRPETAIEQIYYWTESINHEGAKIGVSFQFRTDAADLDGFRLHFHGECEKHHFDYDWPCEFIAGRCMIPVPNARLWWPKGYGKPKLNKQTALVSVKLLSIALKPLERPAAPRQVLRGLNVSTRPRTTPHIL